MTDPTVQRLRAQEEAAGWLARLRRQPVSTDDLFKFQDWKKKNGNAAAYEKVRATWTLAGELVDDPDIRRVTDETLAKRPPREKRAPRHKIGWPIAMLATATVVAAVGGLAIFGNRPPPTYATALGEQSLVTLEDGTRVHLNTDSKVVVRFRRGQRDVELARGEAFFEVAHNPSRPFVVLADGARVRALGTKFDVRRDEGGVRVTLVEGRVQVTRANAPDVATLEPNQKLTVSARGLSSPASTDAASDATWTTGRLTFQAMPLADAVAEVNRYTPRKVTLDVPAAMAKEPVTGEFNAGDTDAFVASVAAVLDLQSAKAADGSSRLFRRRGPPAG